MAIGAAKGQFITPAKVGVYGVSVTPGTIVVGSDNGSASSPVAYSNVINGVGPYAYLWTIQQPVSGDISIHTPTEANTQFTASGFNTAHVGTATITVTDLGKGSAETSTDISVQFIFENFN